MCKGEKKIHKIFLIHFSCAYVWGCKVRRIRKFISHLKGKFGKSKKKSLFNTKMVVKNMQKSLFDAAGSVT